MLAVLIISTAWIVGIPVMVELRHRLERSWNWVNSETVVYIVFWPPVLLLCLAEIALERAGIWRKW